MIFNINKKIFSLQYTRNLLQNSKIDRPLNGRKFSQNSITHKTKSTYLCQVYLMDKHGLNYLK